MSINISLYTTESELVAYKNGATMLIGWVIGLAPQEGAIYNISVPADVCELQGNQIRVNVGLIKSKANDAAAQFASALGSEMERMMKDL